MNSPESLCGGRAKQLSQDSTCTLRTKVGRQGHQEPGLTKAAPFVVDSSLSTARKFEFIFLCKTTTISKENSLASQTLAGELNREEAAWGRVLAKWPGGFPALCCFHAS